MNLLSAEIVVRILEYCQKIIDPAYYPNKVRRIILAYDSS